MHPPPASLVCEELDAGGLADAGLSDQEDGLGYLNGAGYALQ